MQNQNDLIQTLKNLKRSTFASVETFTCQNKNFNKKGNPFNVDDIFKQAKTTVNLNFIYENSVNTVLEKNGQNPDFKAKSNWHHHLDGCSNCIVANKDETKFYLYVKPLKWHQTKFYIKEGEIFRPMTDKELTTLNQFKREKEQKIVDVYMPAIENILSIKILNHVEYKNNELYKLIA